MFLALKTGAFIFTAPIVLDLGSWLDDWEYYRAVDGLAKGLLGLFSGLGDLGDCGYTSLIVPEELDRFVKIGALCLINCYYGWLLSLSRLFCD